MRRQYSVPTIPTNVGNNFTVLKTMVVGLGRLCFTFKSLKILTNGGFVRWKSDAHVVMTDDNSIVVCWHPEKFFPYEKSLPIDMKSTEINGNHGVLKIQSTKELFSILKSKREEIVRKELMEITHTVKHIWFPPKKQFRRKKPTEMDRTYL